MTGEIHVIKTLPWRLEAQSVGFQHAYRNFVNRYGQEEGTRIFLAKGEEQGTGRTLREKCNSVYKNGATIKN